MSQLPGAGAATIDDSKIVQYLLNPAHPSGSAKAKFFGICGFSQANWADFKKALLDHPQLNLVTKQITTRFGEKYEVSCSLRTPNGRNPCVVSVWIIRPNDPNPDLITAYANGP
jgi:uncharacterized protein DUF6883